MMNAGPATGNIVLVHGGFADGSGWRGVYDLLRQDGYQVAVVQNPDLAAFMADSQVPWGLDALGGTITDPAWRGKPSWYLVTTDDKMIPPPAQRTMSARAGSTVTEVAASHSVYISQPAAAAALIKQVAQAVAARQ
jgi:pimeloyl-ACP methyl ester carboxylesterase